MTTTVLLSGGFDSATALASLLDGGDDPGTLFVDYGQSPAAEERAAARAIAEAAGVEHREVEIGGLEIGQEEIPGRNALLAVAGLIATEDVGTVVLAIHRGTPYWDCSTDFLGRMQGVYDGYAEGRVQLLAPFVELGKGDVYRLAAALGVPIDLTYSCEVAGGPCGECLSCKDAEANAG